MVSPFSNRRVTVAAAAFDAGALAPGGVALLTQGGAFANFVFGLARAAGVNFGSPRPATRWISPTLRELLQRVIELPNIKSMLMHLEGIRAVDRFRLAAEWAREFDQPMAVIKVGMSDVEAAAARAHTNSDTGDDQFYGQLFEEYSIHRVEPMTDRAEAKPSLPSHGEAKWL